MDSPEVCDTPEVNEVPEAPEITDEPAGENLTETPPETQTDSSDIPADNGAAAEDDQPADAVETKPITPEVDSTPAGDGKDGILHPEEEVQPEELKPNATYERNGYEYTTDDQGRPMRISGTLRLEEGERTRLQTEVGHMGEEGDEGGHMIGTRFDGPTDAFNLVPQNSNLNRGEWKAMENSWAEALAQDRDVKVIIEPIYGADGKRPESFDVVTQINGELTYRNFANQANADTSAGGKDE
jgi:hypothetical protein